MNNESNFSTDNSSKIWRRLFIGVLSLQAILEFGVGVSLLFFLPAALESGFGITYSNELDILGIALGLYLLLLTALMILSCVWTKRGDYAGITLGIITGIFLVIFGVTYISKIWRSSGNISR